MYVLSLVLSLGLGQAKTIPEICQNKQSEISRGQENHQPKHQPGQTKVARPIPNFHQFLMSVPKDEKLLYPNFFV